MKTIETEIPQFMYDDFFRPLRNKIDFSILLLKACRLLLIRHNINFSDGLNRFLLKINKSKRIFFYSEKKYYSIAFPFDVDVEDNLITQIKTPFKKLIIDNASISNTLSILQDKKFKTNPSLHEYLLDYDSNNAVKSELDIDLGIQILEELFQFEPAYIRYDFDEKHENGDLHPLNHLDVNYSKYGSFKIGLNSKITSEFFEELVDLEIACKFLTN